MYNLNEAIDRNYELMKYVLIGNQNLITESKQLIPNIKQYYNVIWQKVSEITGIKGDDDFLNKEDKTYQINITESDFEGMETFFKRIWFNIQLTTINEFNFYGYDGGYVPQNFMRDINSGKITSMVNGDKLPIVKINVTIKTSVTTIEEAIAACVYHELTHAYEDLERILKNKKENSMSAYCIWANYNNIEKIKMNSEILGDVLYFLKQIEQNAYTAQAIGEIEHNSFRWANDLPEIITETGAYLNYQYLFKCIDNLEKIVNPTVQQQLLQLYNDNASIVGQYNGKNRKYKFNNYGQMVRFFKKKAIYRYNQLIEKLTRHFEDLKIRNMLMIH